MRIYTLGTDHRLPYDFTRILAKYGVQVVFDVRRMPESKEEHFTRRGLENLCSSQGVNYVYLGNELAGPPEGSSFDGRFARHSYQRWQTSPEFQRGFGIIRQKLEKRVCCILCAERSPERCHRRFIGNLLADQGIDVVHILDETSTWQKPPASPIRPRPRGRTTRRRPRR